MAAAEPLLLLGAGDLEAFAAHRAGSCTRVTAVAAAGPERCAARDDLRHLLRPAAAPLPRRRAGARRRRLRPQLPQRQRPRRPLRLRALRHRPAARPARRAPSCTSSTATCATTPTWPRRPGRRRTSQRLLDAIERHAPRGRMLEVGCGHGLLLDEARARGWAGRGARARRRLARARPRRARPRRRATETLEDAEPDGAYRRSCSPTCSSTSTTRSARCDRIARPAGARRRRR